jgi:propionyl-CoA:succinyl-CoA transferase
MNGNGGSDDFHTECVPVDLHLPFQRQGRQDLDHRAAGLAPRSQRALRLNHRPTEYGVADLRGKSPFERALEIIERCAHPEYRELLHSYLTIVEGGHIPHSLLLVIGGVPHA